MWTHLISRRLQKSTRNMIYRIYYTRVVVNIVHNNIIYFTRFVNLVRVLRSTGETRLRTFYSIYVFPVYKLFEKGWRRRSKGKRVNDFSLATLQNETSSKCVGEFANTYTYNRYIIFFTHTIYFELRWIVDTSGRFDFDKHWRSTKHSIIYIHNISNLHNSVQCIMLSYCWEKETNQ